MYTAQFFSRTTRCHPLGEDIVYLPVTSDREAKTYYKLPKQREWIKGVLPPDIFARFAHSSAIVSFLQREYERHVQTFGEDPEWLHNMNRCQQAEFCRCHTITEGELLFALPSVPYAGIGYIVTDSGFTHRACETFNLFRLQNIAQLGRLHDPVVVEAGMTPLSYGMLFGQNRLAHSLDVRAIALLMAKNNNLDPRRTRILETAGLTHDALTPAYGDGTKSIDPSFFDEDANYRNLLCGDRWETFRRDYDIDADALVATVQGEGPLGSLLDIADKLSYLSRDVQPYIGRYSPDGPISYSDGYHEVYRFISKRKHLLGLWGTVRTKGDVVFVEDGVWLGDVLTLRAWMFRNLYHHQGSRYLERMTAVVLVRHLIDIGAITKDDLLRYDDFFLDKMIRERFGVEVNPVVADSYNANPRVEVCTTLAHAEERERELLRSGVGITFIDAHPPAKPATHLLVRKKGKILPFAEAYPHETEEIDTIIKGIPTVKVYYLDVPRDRLPWQLREVADIVRKKALNS